MTYGKEMVLMEKGLPGSCLSMRDADTGKGKVAWINKQVLAKGRLIVGKQ